MTGAELKKARKKLSMTQKEMGNKMFGKTKEAVRLWEKSEKIPFDVERQIRMAFLSQGLNLTEFLEEN